MKTKKILYGILAIGPIVIMVLGFILMFAGTFGAIGHGMMTQGPGHNPFAFLLGLNYIMMMIGIFGFMVGFVVFLIHALNNPKLGQEMKVVWAIVMVFFAGIAPVIYYGLYIFSDAGYGNAPSPQVQPHAQPQAQAPEPATPGETRDITIV